MYYYLTSSLAWLESFIHTLWDFHYHFSAKVMDQINVKTCCSSLLLSLYASETSALQFSSLHAHFCFKLAPQQEVIHKW